MTYIPRHNLMAYLLAGTMLHRAGVVYWYDGKVIRQGRVSGKGVTSEHTLTLPIAGEFFGRLSVNDFDLYPDDIKSELLTRID